MKKIYYILIFLVPFLSFSQWEKLDSDIRKDSLYCGGLKLNKKGDKIIQNFFQLSDNKIHTNLVRVYHFANNNWQQLGKDIGVIVDSINRYDYHSHVDINDEGNVISMSTVKYQEDGFIDTFVNQQYKFDGNNWVKYGDSFKKKDFEDDYCYNFIGTTNTVAYMTNDSLKEDNLHIYSFVNGKWIKKGEKILIKDLHEKALYMSKDGNTIMFSAWSYEAKEKTIVSHKFDGKKWNLNGNHIVVPESDLYLNELQINKEGNRILSINEDQTTKNRFCVVYENTSGSWKQIGNKITPKPINGKVKIYRTNISENGNYIALSFGEKEQAEKMFFSVYRLEDNKWNELEINTKKENSIHAFDFNDTGDFLALDYAFERLTEVYKHKKLSVLDHSFGNHFKIFPNPTLGPVSIKLGATYETINVSITNVLGKQIETLAYSNTDTLNLNTNYQPGLYFISVKSKHKTATLKLIIK